MSSILRLLVDGASVAFDPDPGWSWSQWSGDLELRSCRSWRSQGRSVGLAIDLEHLGYELMGRCYVADQFDDIPGTVLSAAVDVRADTLATRSRLDGARVATEGTSGRFWVQLQPAIRTGSPPICDPLTLRRGSFHVIRPGQDRTTTR